MVTEIWLRKYDGDNITMCYKAKVFTNISWKFASPVSPMPLPEEDGESNVLVKMEGNSHVVNLTFVIKNEKTENAGISAFRLVEGSEVSLGGYAGSSKTIFEQIKWMSSGEDKTASGGGFIGRHMADEFDICILESTNGLDLADMTEVDAVNTKSEFDPLLTGGQNSTPADEPVAGLSLQMHGYIRNISFQTSSSEPATLRGTIEFIEGEVAGGYQSKVPMRVRNFKVLTPTSGTTHNRMFLSYSPPEHAGNSAIVKYDIGHKESSSTGEYIIQNPSPLTSNFVEVLALAAATSYEWKVRAVNSDGDGKWTTPKTKSTNAAP